MNDHQMMRGHDDGNYNFAVGEAFFLADNLYWASTRDVGFGPYYYPVATGEKELIEEIKHLYPDKYVVVTNGCKQAISAAMYAFREVYGFSSAHHDAPYWPSYPTLIKLADLAYSSSHSLRLATLVNNPNGSVTTGESDLLDCAYGHYVYGWEGELPKHKVSVWSAAKLFGAAGLRLGWILTDDKDLADKAAFYEEITTSGVSTLSQRCVTKILKYQREHQDIVKNTYSKARSVLLGNGDCFNQLLGQYCAVIQGVPLDGMGMFAWFQIAPEYQEKFSGALNKLNIRLVTGNACGATQVGWYRMNMGHRNAITQEMLEKLGQELRS